MAFADEIVKLQRQRSVYTRLALDENNGTRLWSGPVDRRYGKAYDRVDLIPITGTVQRLGTVQRSLVNFLQTLEVPNITVELLDPDREWRAQAGGIDDQLVYRNLSLWLRVFDDLGLGFFDQRVAVAQIRKSVFPSGGSVQLECQVASGGFLGDKIPRRFITTTDFPNADPEVQGLPVPIIYGVMYDKVVPFVLPDPLPPGSDPVPGGSTSDTPTSLPPITGSEVMNCDDMFTDNFEGGSLAAYSSGSSNFTLVPGAGVGGSTGLRPTVANAGLTKTVAAPRRAFCVSWESKNDQASVDTALGIGSGLALNRLGTTLSVSFGPYGEVASVAGAITPGTNQSFKVEGAFATRNIATTLVTAINDTETEIVLPTGQGVRFPTGTLIFMGTEVMQVASVAGDHLIVTRHAGSSVASAHAAGDPVASRDTNGYLRVYIDNVVRVNLLNDNRIATSDPDGLYTDVTVYPGGDADNLHIGSGIQFTPPTPPSTTPGDKSPFGGTPGNPAPTPDCKSLEAGGGSPSGGAVRAIRVGGYVSTTTDSGGGPTPTPTPQIAAPVVSISVVGSGGTGEYQYVVTAIDETGPDPNDFSQRNNHTGESIASNVVHITNGPTHDGDFSSSNYVHLQWPLVPGAKFYRVYGRYMEYEPFSLLDVYTGDSGGNGYYNDGEFLGRNEFDILKTDSRPPTTAPTGGGGAPHVNNVYVLAGHALKEVTEVYVLKPVIIQNFSAPTTGTDGTIDTTTDTTPLRSDPVQVLQVEGVDYTQRYVDINDNRYHILEFNAAQQSETCEYYEVTANVKGIETNGDTTGTLITNAVEMFSHFWLNWMANNYRSSVGGFAPPTGPWFTDVVYSPGLWDAAAALTARGVCNSRVFGGYVAAGCLDETIEARELIRELLTSFDLELYFNNSTGPSGAWSLSMFNPVVNMGDLPLYDASDIIFADTFAVEVQIDKMLNVFPFFAGPTRQRTGKNDPGTLTSGGGWLISGDSRSTASISRFGMSISEPLYLKWTRDPATAVDVVEHYKSYLQVPPIQATFRTGMRPLVDPLASLIRVNHPDGIGGTAGWTNHICKLTRSDLELDRITTALTLISVDDLIVRL